ncbi:hypothetical protein OUZ56_011712 [Daphnia magna]|uniref:Uncharacterized protein n=1 Tax=Daphnia magna TaxID=35525 RepID=A0ABQ9Z193_9CRUS|nr:hypothetical protein OUZ56_011712 [Daphnia magna]
MAAAVNHMPSLLQSRTAFHSTVKFIVDYNPTVFIDCPLFTTRYTATNFNEQPATHYLLNRTVGSWLRSLLQFPSNHQLMFLTAPLTAFKHDSEAAGRLAALPFAAPKQPQTHYIQPAFLFASTRQPPISSGRRLLISFSSVTFSIVDTFTGPSIENK